MQPNEIHKKNQKVSYFARGVLACDLVPWKKTKQGIWKCEGKNFPKNAIRYDFTWLSTQMRPSRCPKPCQTSRSCTLTLHIDASSQSKQHCRLEFSNFPHKKVIFHFISAQSGLFCESSTKINLQNGLLSIFTCT